MAGILLPHENPERKRHKERTCRVCGALSSVVRWYSNITTHCAECWKEQVRQHRSENADHYKAFDKRRAMLPHRVEARRAYQNTPQGKAALQRSHAKYQAKCPDKRRAHIAVGNAVRDGRLTKPNSCERCGTEGSAKRSLHAHHADYSQPFSVEWLCGTCHRHEHRERP